ncbi:MAG: methyltransferase type 12 [Deltaproteobacteria bacterium]|nr:methyltransferase type 12 [Deltaproteobacteria bacterium]
MSNTKPVFSLLDGRFVFFQEFLKHPLQVGSIIPSSRFLEQRILEAAGIATVKTVIELGSGTGGTTRAILRAMPQNAKLLSIEINPHFHTLVSSIKDDRLIAHLGNACRLKEIVSMYGLGVPEALISGIPFSTMKQGEASQVIEAISSLLPSNGCFVAYQVSKRVESLCRPFLGSGRMSVEFLNIPPMRVYKWNKNGAS